MHIKPKDPKVFVTPAPGAYNPENADRDVKLSAPKYSFGIKPKGEKAAQGPGIKFFSLFPNYACFKPGPLPIIGLQVGIYILQSQVFLTTTCSHTQVLSNSVSSFVSV